MEWCRTRRKGGVSQYLTIQVYMRSKRLGSGVCSFANYLLTEEAPLQKAFKSLFNPHFPSKALISLS